MSVLGDGDTEQRQRLARDLHDAVGHNMSLVCLQAGVALHLLAGGDGETQVADGRSERVRESLVAIRQASEEALVELREMLGVLRQADEPSGPDEHPAVELPGSATGSGAGPAGPEQTRPSLQRLGELVERFQTSGLDVLVELHGHPAPNMLPRPLDAAAFRILRESLTNVVRHSDSTQARVRITVDDRTLTLEVLDDGTHHSAPSLLPPSGHGTTGMREQAAALGGHLAAGPQPGRGFAVRATFPLDNEHARHEQTHSPQPPTAEHPGPPTISVSLPRQSASSPPGPLGHDAPALAEAPCDLQAPGIIAHERLPCICGHGYLE